MGASTYTGGAPISDNLTYLMPFTSSQEPPFTTPSTPCCFRNIAPCPLLFPETQQSIMGLGIDLISSIRSGNSCNGILIEPATWAPTNSHVLRTSIIVAVSRLLTLVVLFCKNTVGHCYLTAINVTQSVCLYKFHRRWLHASANILKKIHPRI